MKSKKLQSAIIKPDKDIKLPENVKRKLKELIQWRLDSEKSLEGFELGPIYDKNGKKIGDGWTKSDEYGHRFGINGNRIS